MPIDASVFDKIKNYSDYAQADQDFQMRKAAAAQALQTGGIDAASKANIYKTQLLSGAAAGGQSAYDQARATLQQQGIDTSEFAPDVATAGQQLQAARLAQSPLGSLINAGTKMTANDLAAVATYGSMEAAQKAGYKPEGMALPNMGSFSGVTPSVAPSAPPSSVAPPATTPAPTPAPNPISPPNAAAVQAVFPAANAVPPVNTASSIAGTNLTPSGALPGTEQLQPPIAGATPKFNPPPQNPGESIAAYNARVQQAFESYKADPAVVQQQASAKAQGEAAGEFPEKAAAAQELMGRIDKNLDAMVQSNPDVPQSRWGVSADSRAWLSQNFGSQDAANAYNAFTKVNKAQILNGIQELVQSGSIRNSKALINLVSDVNAIDENANPASRAQQIGAVRAEIHNLATSSANINARLNGGQVQPYENVPVSVGTTSSPRPGMTQQGTDGTYMFNGGDPSVQTNWKKVK